MKSVIVGTAGHIDHGKTSLVRALTGVDADRLPEEKRRGITIDLGFAELDLGDVRVGFVDVPGHERFVKNMLAGAHGLDAVALVVAADEGVMPQTREHFDIARLLGVRAGLVVVTKTDAVEEDLLALVRAETEELVAGSFLESAPVVPVSSRTGAGLDDLKRVLREVALRAPARSDAWAARLPVDRAFTMRGFGAVVTGTLVAGEIAEGQELELLPGGLRARVRGLQVHGRATARATAGQRTAVNLGGVEVAEVERGMVLAHTGRLAPTQVLDARIEVLADAPRPLKSRARVRVHLGAAEALARAAVLEEAGEIAPGESGFVQLRLESPVVALPGERFIVRSYSPQRTVAGGVVLDAGAARHRGRERRDARTRLESHARAVAADDRAAQLAAYVASAGERGLSRASLAARTGWRDEVIEAAIEEGKRRGPAATSEGATLTSEEATLKGATARAARRAAVADSESVSVKPDGAAVEDGGAFVEAEGVLVSRGALGRLIDAAVEETEAHHRREPLQRGLARETLRERVFARAPAELFRAALSEAERAGRLVAERDVVRAPAHTLELSGADAALRARLERIYGEAALEAPALEDALARAAEAEGSTRERARRVLQLLLDDGTLRRVTPELLFHRDALARLVERLRAHATATPDRLIDVAAFKDLAGVSRKYAIPLLEHLDRERVTRRAGDRRLVL